MGFKHLFQVTYLQRNGASVKMLDRQDGVKSVLLSHLQLHAKRCVEEEPPWQVSGSEGRGQGWVWTPPPTGMHREPYTCASAPKESLWLGRGEGMAGWGEEVLLNTINWISLFKKNKRPREKQHVPVKTTLVLDNF